MAEKNRVYEVARKHDLTSKALLGVLQELGIVAKSHMSVLSDEDIAIVEKHFDELQAQGEKVVEKAPRVEVQKGKARPKRMSAREKLEAKRLEKEARRKKAAEDPAEAEEQPDEATEVTEKPSLKKVEAPRKTEKETPEPESRPRLEKMKVVKPTGLPRTKPAEEARPEVEEEKPAAKGPSRSTQKVDLSSIAEAAKKTRAQIADDMKTKVAKPEPKRPRRKDAPARGPKVSDASQESQPRPIDPNAIRSSVRKALGGINVKRGGGRPRGGPGQAPAGPPSKRRKGSRQIREEKRQKVERHRAREEAQQTRDNELRLTEFITVQELAEKLDAKPQELMMKLMGLGVMATINQRLERAQIELLVSDYEDLEIHWLDTSAGEDIEIEAEEGREAKSRPPVVTVMGHVDHGKTTLLDYLRSTNVTAGEAGGITQHIGAYQVDTPRGPIAFLDTPGHQAFTAMRARGAKVTDIVVVVVAADDKVMPQTKEALDHAKASGCPTIIAINKIDLPAADIPGVKQDLMQHNVLIEEFGGDVQCVEISAKKGENIDALLEAIALQAEILELKAPDEGRARGTVVEARKDLGRGAVFTVLVTQGTLRVGDPFVVGDCDGRVRAMFDESDQPVEEAGPSRPVLVLGANDVPVAGDQMDVVTGDSEAKEIAGRRRRLHREQALHAPKKQATLESLFDRMQEQEEAVELSVVIKGDVSGSVEALADALMGLSNEKVTVDVIHSGVGGINNNDIMLASASDAIVVGFHLRPDPATRAFAAEKKVDLRLYDIIYEVVEDVKAAMQGLLAPVDREVRSGSAEVRDLFRVPKVGTIAGSYVLEGEIKRNNRVRVVRDQVEIYDGRIGSLKRFKEDARSVASGYECGISIEGFDDIKVGDILEAYEVEQVAQEM